MPSPGRRRPSLRQRDELRLPGNRIETAGLPVLFGLFDPLLARGHEVPPDVTGSLRPGATEKHNTRGAPGGQRDAVASSEDEQARSFKQIAGNLDFALDDVD